MPVDYRDEDEDQPERPVDNSEADEKLLKEIRDKYTYASDYWRDARDESNKDRRYICGDPWEPEERKAREDAKRPVISHDEMSQYVHQALNNVRHNKRAIRVQPAGEGTSEQTAEYRQNRIRAIEYRCKAQAVYETGFQQMLEGSYGFWRISRDYVSSDPDNWDQDVIISSIPNQDSVLYDPDCKQPDWSDAEFAFVVEPMRRDKFKRDFPNARRTDFTSEDMNIAPGWIQSETILVAEYWRVITDNTVQKRKNPRTGEIERRTCKCKHVWSYLTNGVEILERTEEIGDEIPIIACIGLERYISEIAKGTKDTSTRRKIFSLVRLARDPQMSLAYLCSLEAEAAGLTPKTPWVGYTGQFESHRKEWETALKIPHAFLEADPIPDTSNGQILPLPARQVLTVDFGAFQIAKDSARRAVMAAMGISPLPTAAMRATEKSGVAIQRIQQEQSMGSYHFIDNFERAIERTGRIVESWLPVIDSGERTVALCAPDDSRRIVRINTGQPYLNQQTGEAEHYPVEEGEHDVTVSVGPSSQSQRDAANDQLQALLSNLEIITQIIGPPAAAQLLALSLKMLQLGPIGDQMVQTISPQQEQLSPQAQQMMTQAQQQLQALNAHAQQLEQVIAQLQQEKQSKVVEGEYKLKIEQLKGEMQLASERFRAETQLLVAEIQTRAQMQSERTQLYQDEWQQIHEHAHDVGLQAHKQSHEAAQADAQRMHERGLQDAQAQAEKDKAQLEMQAAQAQQEAQPNGSGAGGEA